MGIMAKFSKGTTIESAYLKFGAHGEAGSGKTTVCVLGAIAMHKHLVARNHPDAKKGVAMVDSEGGSDYIKPRFEREGIDFYSLKTRRAADLFEALKDAELHAAVHSIVIDSATHFWREFMTSYMEQKKRSYLQIDDWGYLKPKWNEEFTVPYLNSPVHVFMAGRSGDDLEETRDENGKKKLVKVGVKMKVEGETAYEPSLLFYLEADQIMIGGNVGTGTKHRAHVFKDRFDVIQGKSFEFTTQEGEPQDHQVKRVWSWIAPHVTMLNLGGQHKPIDTESSASIHPRPDGKPAWQWEAEMRDIALDKLNTLFSCEINVATADGKKKRAALLAKHAGTEAMTEVEKMKPDIITAIFEAIHMELRGCSSLEYIKRMSGSKTVAEMGAAKTPLSEAAGNVDSQEDALRTAEIEKNKQEQQGKTEPEPQPDKQGVAAQVHGGSNAASHGDVPDEQQEKGQSAKGGGKPGKHAKPRDAAVVGEAGQTGSLNL